MKANKKYKDSVFSLYFNDPKKLIEVYNAVEGTNYPLDTKVEINTLEDALFMDRINDISFMLNGELVVLLEHQSTINENMPVRMLMYVARIYEKILSSRDLYKSTRMKIPTPRFIVLYNGNKEYQEHEVQKLSDAFARKDIEFTLDLKVDVININYGKSKEIVERSQSLMEYSTLVHYTKEALKKGMSLNDAIGMAVKKCLAEGIMADFLNTHGSEVENMLFTEWNMEDALAVRYEEGREEGIKALVETLKEFVSDKTLVSQRVSKKFSITVDEAMEKVKLYWNES